MPIDLRALVNPETTAVLTMELQRGITGDLAAMQQLAEEVRAGAEEIITRNGESCVALVDARRLDHYRRLEREHIHLALLEEAAQVTMRRRLPRPVPRLRRPVLRRMAHARYDRPSAR